MYKVQFEKLLISTENIIINHKLFDEDFELIAV